MIKRFLSRIADLADSWTNAVNENPEARKAALRQRDRV